MSDLANGDHLEQPAHPDRIVEADGAFNVRDLGGLTAADGRTVASGRLYRSDFPVFLSNRATTSDNPLGIRTVVDLRRESERDFESADAERFGLTYVNTPFLTAHGTSWTAGYEQYFETDPNAVVAAVTILMQSGNQPALFHCAAGKDRTGVLTALLLESLGVDREQIVDDFSLTEIGMPALHIQLLQREPYRSLISGMTLQDHMPKVERLFRLFDYLDTTAGGAVGWLREHGLSEEILTEFRRTMLVSN